ncbi:MAG TPA: NYN domain-containing protein [Candidatus Nanoarchaeia archaeon]|nr:NYN domain-containing protein [Candidatus Nanoarchaeia archaeon]
MEETLVFIDEGFLSKLSKHLGKTKYIKINYLKFAKQLSKKQNLFCKKIFYYTAPPYQSEPPSEKEELMKKGYDCFIKSFKKNNEVIVREGRCQKIKDENGETRYKQKGVDTLLTIDLSHLKEDYPEIKKIILISSDTDFCPAIKDIKKRWNTEVLLYTYFDRKRKSKFSLSNDLIACCSKYFKLTKEDFLSAPLNKNENKKIN